MLISSIVIAPSVPKWESSGCGEIIDWVKVERETLTRARALTVIKIVSCYSSDLSSTVVWSLMEVGLEIIGQC